VNKKQYTYKPFGNTRKNRSRIDFFLISRGMINTGTECRIGDSTLGSFFDHKPCHLRLKSGNKHTRKRRLAIFNSILSDPDVDIVAWFTTFETYLHHIAIDGRGGGGGGRCE
jgi:succinate dehydrogenase flavin-adding protein (antitoxin of CptAB toxin-antitoxin module)